MSGTYSWISFEEWYRRSRPRWVAALTVATGEFDLAVDPADESMVSALQHWDRVQAMESPDGWAYRVGVNLLPRRMRRRAFERRLLIRSEAVVLAIIEFRVLRSSNLAVHRSVSVALGDQLG